MNNKRVFIAMNKKTDSNKKQRKPLCHHVEKSVEQYFVDMEESTVDNLYEKVIAEIERPLLTVVMQKVNNNQSEAAKILGLNRNTLRKKLKIHDMLATNK